VPRPTIDLEPQQIVDAALEVFHADGLDAVSMRSVAAQLGVSPVPVYDRIGKKEDLLAAMADRLLVDVAPRPRAKETWPRYAVRWALALRERLSSTDVRLLIGQRREPFVEASRPLVDKLVGCGFSRDGAVQACRLLIWATMGFVTVEQGRQDTPGRRARARVAGGDPVGISAAERDQLFRMNLDYLVDGLARDADRASHS
jgi:AcrR family transcriptional regulator